MQLYLRVKKKKNTRGIGTVLDLVLGVQMTLGKTSVGEKHVDWVRAERGGEDIPGHRIWMKWCTSGI